MTSVLSKKSLEALQELGLTKLEALTYVALLKNGSSTGYGLAKAIQKPASNAYRIVEGLVSKGLVVLEDGPKKRYTAMPYAQMLDRLGRKFRDNQSLVASELANLQVENQDARVYRIDSAEQVFEQCIQTLESATELILIDAFPDLLVRILPQIEAAIAKGITVRIKAYDEFELAGATVIYDYRGKAVLEEWPERWLVVITDGAEYIQACFQSDKTNTEFDLIQAIWTESAFFSWIAYSGLNAEMAVDIVRRVISKGGGGEDILKSIESLSIEKNRTLPGRMRLMGKIDTQA